MAMGQGDYYLSAVAQGAEDYYLGAGEAPGQWCGSGAQDLDLDGEVGPDELRAVLGGHAPSDGRRLVRGNRKLPGFDCTFSQFLALRNHRGDSTGLSPLRPAALGALGVAARKTPDW